MATSGLSFEKPLVGAGWAISQVLSINGPRKQWSHLAEPRIPVFKADFSARASYRRPSILITYTLTSGCGQNHECGKHGCLCEVLSVKTDGNFI